MLRLWISKNKRILFLPLIVFVFALLVGSLLGLSDDEAYYWVLAQRPAWGYAFHPPMIAWLIAGAQKLFGGHSPGLVRLPAALCAGSLVFLAGAWLKKTGVSEKRVIRGQAAVLGFGGLFSLCWMMVPDLPLFVGWTLAFLATWEICHGPSGKQEAKWAKPLLAIGTLITMLSKFSAVLACASAFFAILLWAPKARKKTAIAWLAAGAILAAIPILLWNASHAWGAILYQIRDRHEGAELSFVRYARFWAAEILLAGPPLVLIGFKALFAKKPSRETKFVAAWAAPAALVFFVQPLFSDFKPHWAFVVWWPVALLSGWFFSREGGRTQGASIPKSWILAQMAYGYALIALVTLSCFLPLGSFFSRDPRLDVTNDFYGWRLLRGSVDRDLPVVGSRYQTAAQAAFALAGRERVTLLPRDTKEMDEWPNLDVSYGQGPSWPALKRPVYFVSDNRYDAPPGFPGAECRKVRKIEKRRFGFLAKRIDVWRCEPGAARP